MSEPPAGPQWLHEIKWDGWRYQIIKDDHGIRIFSRRGTDWSAQLPGTLDAARDLEADSFIIDGELVAIGGQSDFYAIPTAIKRRQVCVVAFDLLNLDGDDIRQAALQDRRGRLGKMPATVPTTPSHSPEPRLISNLYSFAERVFSFSRQAPYPVPPPPLAPG